MARTLPHVHVHYRNLGTVDIPNFETELRMNVMNPITIFIKNYLMQVQLPNNCNCLKKVSKNMKLI